MTPIEAHKKAIELTIAELNCMTQKGRFNAETLVGDDGRIRTDVFDIFFKPMTIWTSPDGIQNVLVWSNTLDGMGDIFPRHYKAALDE